MTFKNWTVGRRLIAGFGLAGLTLLLVIVVSYRNIAGLIENDDRVEQSHQVRVELADLLSELNDAETGQRGYLLTGIESYLQPYEAAVPEIKVTFAKVADLTADNPLQKPRLAKLSPLIDAKLAELEQTIALRRTQDIGAALKIVLGSNGKTLMDQIRTVIGQSDQDAV
ncbi:MAG TPA: CHASE3 domain-containing protein, partial [Rhodopila sp.]|nr:CHASE3 domain-containing protein [Rhodopila sp.]